MEPQRHITGLRFSDFKDEGINRTVVTTQTSEKIFAYAEYGYITESDSYAISWIARSVDYAGQGLGDSLLKIVLDDIAVDAFEGKRGTYVLTQIHPENEKSIAMFTKEGFRDKGVDFSDNGFHLWVKKFEPYGKPTVHHDFIVNSSL